MLDLDYFKMVNDTYGHDCGDQVLCEIANRVRAQIRATDALIRWGGEEFLVILPAIESVDLASVAERLRSMVAAAWLSLENESLRTAVSVGGTLAQDQDDAASVVARADAMLYVAKQAGRNRVIIG